VERVDRGRLRHLGLRSMLSRVMGEEQNIREWCAIYRVADHRLSQGQTVGAR